MKERLECLEEEGRAREGRWREELAGHHRALKQTLAEEKARGRRELREVESRWERRMERMKEKLRVQGIGQGAPRYAADPKVVVRASGEGHRDGRYQPYKYPHQAPKLLSPVLPPSLPPPPKSSTSHTITPFVPPLVPPLCPPLPTLPLQPDLFAPLPVPASSLSLVPPRVRSTHSLHSTVKAVRRRRERAAAVGPL